MGKKIIFAVGGGILLLLGLLSYNYLFKSPCDPPRKLDSVPEKASWFGGCDGGNWIELINVKEDKYRFKVYRDWDGELSIDADFVVKNCNNLALNENNWKERLAYYNEGEEASVRIVLKGGDNCYLESIIPAYGGEDWKVIKEKTKEY
jgi:hypothetical protein